MLAKRLTFYFDFISPYAYFSWRKMDDFCKLHQLELTIQPVVFGKLLDHWGQLGPAEIPPKRALLLKYCYRYAKLHGFEMKGPKCHPFNSLNALRLSLREVSGENQSKVVSAIFEAGWSMGKDLGDLNVLTDILNSAGLNGQALADLAQQDANKALLKTGTQAAIEKGVFGVPSMIIDDELFWGNDQFEHMALFARGEDFVEPNQFKEAINRERGIDRKKITER